MDKNSAKQLRMQCEKSLAVQFERLDEIALYNQKKYSTLLKINLYRRVICAELRATDTTI